MKTVLEFKDDERAQAIAAINAAPLAIRLTAFSEYLYDLLNDSKNEKDYELLLKVIKTFNVMMSEFMD